MPINNRHIKVCIDDSANGILSPHKILVEGQMLKTGHAEPDTIVEVLDKDSIDILFGVGSILSESLKIAYDQNRISRIYALPRLDASNAVKAQYKLTIRGTAQRNFPLRIFAGNDTYEILLNVEKGTTAADFVKRVAAAVVPTFPFTAVSEGNSVIFTAKNGGEVGNVLNPLDSWPEFMGSTASGFSASMYQTVIGSGDPAPNDYQEIAHGCSYAIYILNTPNIAWHQTLDNYLATQWDCSKGNLRGGHGYVYVAGSLQDVLDSKTNTPRLSKLAIHLDDHVFPYLKNTAFGALSGYHYEVEELRNVAVAGDTYGLLEAIKAPVSCQTLWTEAEEDILAKNGFVIADNVVNELNGGYASPVITNDITNYITDASGTPNLTWRSAVTVRLLLFIVDRVSEILDEYMATSILQKGAHIPDGTVGASAAMIEARLRLDLREYEGRFLNSKTFDPRERSIRVYDPAEESTICNGTSDTLKVELRLYLPNVLNKIEVKINPILSKCRGAN